MPENTVVVARPTKWGNPWRVGEPDIRDATEAARRFRCAVVGFISNGSFCPPQARPGSIIRRIIDDAPQLRGKNLACWCAIRRNGEYVPCHADVLLSLANDIPLEDVVSENIRRAKGEAAQ